MKKLDLSYNNIGADGAGMIDESGNSLEIITDLSPLAGLTNLKDLGLEDNEITDISPLKGLTNLTGLFLDGNKIAADQLEMIWEALPDCEIYFN